MSSRRRPHTNDRRALEPVSRHGWVDVLKGLAIILVVAQHVVDFLEAVHWTYQPLLLALAAIGSVRMPAFFLASALFFGANFKHPWAHVLVRKVLPMLYLYTLWVLIRATYLMFGPWPLDPSISPFDFAISMYVDPRSSMWFVYALAIYFVLARATNGLPYAIGWIIAAAPSFAAMTGYLSTGNWAWDSIIKAYFFFYAGTQLFGLVTRVKTAFRAWHVAVLTLIWASLIAVSYYLFGVLSNPLLPLISIAGLAALVIAVIIVERHTPLQLLQRVGRSTLPVYLLHVYIIAPIAAALATMTPNSIEVVAAFLIITAVAVAGSYLVWLPLRRVPGLFVAPWLAPAPIQRA